MNSLSLSNQNFPKPTNDIPGLFKDFRGLDYGASKFKDFQKTFKDPVVPRGCIQSHSNQSWKLVVLKLDTSNLVHVPRRREIPALGINYVNLCSQIRTQIIRSQMCLPNGQQARGEKAIPQTVVTMMWDQQFFSSIAYTENTQLRIIQLVAWHSRSLTGELSLSCARPAADGWPLMWVSHPLQISQLGQLSLSSYWGR